MNKNLSRPLTVDEYRLLKADMQFAVSFELKASPDTDTKVIPATSIDELLRKSGAEGIPKVPRSTPRTVKISMYGVDLEIKAEYHGGIRGDSLGAAYKVIEVNGKPVKPEHSLKFLFSLHAEAASASDPKSKYDASAREIREELESGGLELRYKGAPVAHSRLIGGEIRNGEKDKAPSFVGKVRVTQVF